MRFIMQVTSRAVVGREVAYRDWYKSYHLSDVLTLPGFKSATLDRQLGENENATRGFIARYEVEAETPAAAMQALGAAWPSMRHTEDTGADGTRVEFLVREAVESAKDFVERLSDHDVSSNREKILARALRTIQSPQVVRARQLAAMRFRWVLRDDPPDEAWSSFDAMMDEYVFNNALKAANADPNYPEVMLNYAMPHEWHGIHVPGSRVNGDNCDNAYRLIPIDGKANFRLEGRRAAYGPSDVTFTLVGNWEMTKTLAGLEGSSLEYGPDGEFVITIGPDPANGKPNHIQSRPGAVMLFVRDSLGDWDQQPNEMRIHRLDPPDAPPMTDQQIAERAAELIIDSVPQVYWYLKYIHGSPNAFPQLIKSDTAGGLSTQRGNAASAILADDEAMILTFDPCGANYFSVICQDYWWITMDYGRITSSRNTAQSALNEDGTVTYVVCGQDPGVHNWIDTAGLHNVVLNVRLQGLPTELEKEPLLTSRIVKLRDLDASLPAGMRRATAEQRTAEIAERMRQVAERYARI